MSSTKKEFLIIDGHALIHRAWHAMPPMQTKAGLVTHGAYGFTTIMLNAIKKFRPEYMAVTFDLEGGTFRNDLYDDYKATREEKPQELYDQVIPIRKILEAMQIPVFSLKGYEADDIIGTLALMAQKQSKDVETIIVTGDMDTLQLVDERTKVFTMRKGMSDTVVYDIAAVKERFGFKPIQLIDYKALRGDPSDNIPGVKGVGEKTGSDLIVQFGSVPALYESLEKNDKKAQALKEGVRAKLIADKKNAMLALDLCRIRRDAPIDFKLRDCEFKPATRERMTAIFTELEFMKLLNTIPAEVAASDSPKKVVQAVVNATAQMFDTVSPASPSYIEVRDIKGLTAALSQLERTAEVAFRFLSDNDPYAPKILALGLADAFNVYVVGPRIVADGKILLRKFFASKTRKICHDLKRELKVMMTAGIEFPSIAKHDGFFDLMIASYLLHSGERRHSLDAILAYERSVPLADEPAEDQRVNAMVAQLPHFIPLADSFSRLLIGDGLVKLNEEMELPLAEVLAQMEINGIDIDVPYFKKIAVDIGAELKSLTKNIYKHAKEEFNINSPSQMKVVLFDKMGISTEGLKKTAKGGTLSTAASELEKLKDAHPIIGEILRYRELAKLQSTYIEALPDAAHPTTGRVHAEFNQTVAATGRLSSANPNMQNIPTPDSDYGKRVRDGFVASKGFVLVAVDYSQIELRIAADMAKEKLFVQAFKAGEDIHYRTAVEMFGEKNAKSHRRIAKIINFGILYGMGANRLADAADISFNEAREYIEKYRTLHKGISSFMDDIKEQIVRDGYVETMFGRKRFFKNVKFMNPRERAEAERQAVNMPIQGTSADMTKVAMVRIAPWIAAEYGADKARMLLQVHDELVFEVRKELVSEFCAGVKPLMEGVRKLAVPVVVNVSTGTRWGSMKPV